MAHVLRNITDKELTEPSRYGPAVKFIKLHDDLTNIQLYMYINCS